MGPGDGFAIQFLANGPANDVQPGSSLSFSFTTADPPASVNGNSMFYPGVPTSTSTVYPQGPFSDAGHQFVVTPSQSPTTPTPSPTPATSPPVTVVGVEDVKGKKNSVSEIVVNLSGPVNAAQADDVATYRLATANVKGSFTARGSRVIKLRSAVFNPANDTVILIPAKAFALTRPVELTIDGTSPSGLQDTSGRLIDGVDDGTAGGNAVAVIRRNGVTLNPDDPATTRVSRAVRPAPFAGSITVIQPPPAVLGSTLTPTPVVLGSTPAPTPVAITPTPTPIRGVTSPGPTPTPAPTPTPSPTPTPPPYYP